MRIEHVSFLQVSLYKVVFLVLFMYQGIWKKKKRAHIKVCLLGEHARVHSVTLTHGLFVLVQ